MGQKCFHSFITHFTGAGLRRAGMKEPDKKHFARIFIPCSACPPFLWLNSTTDRHRDTQKTQQKGFCSHIHIIANLVDGLLSFFFLCLFFVRANTSPINRFCSPTHISGAQTAETDSRQIHQYHIGWRCGALKQRTLSTQP